jgi:hypothetical protein
VLRLPGVIPPLIISEIIRPRLSYDVRRWATVFPFGMYAACSLPSVRWPAFRGHNLSRLAAAGRPPAEGTRDGS